MADPKEPGLEDLEELAAPGEGGGKIEGNTGSPTEEELAKLKEQVALQSEELAKLKERVDSYVEEERGGEERSADSEALKSRGIAESLKSSSGMAEVLALKAGVELTRPAQLAVEFLFVNAAIMCFANMPSMVELLMSNMPGWGYVRMGLGLAMIYGAISFEKGFEGLRDCLLDKVDELEGVSDDELEPGADYKLAGE